MEAGSFFLSPGGANQKVAGKRECGLSAGLPGEKLRAFRRPAASFGPACESVSAFFDMETPASADEECPKSQTKSLGAFQTRRRAQRL